MHEELPGRRTDMAGRRGAQWLVMGAAVAALLFAGKRARGDGPQTWTVKSGDVLGSVAKRFGVSVQELRRCNDLDGDTIRVGQELIVDCELDSEDAASGAAPPSAPYEVQRGDTLSGIADRFDTSIDRLLELNPELDPDRLRAGRTIRVERRLVRHEIRAGETLTRIARHHRVSVQDLVRWNPGLEPDRIRIGATLRVYTDRPPSVSESVGLPYRGRLENAVQLPPHPAFEIRDRDLAWGTRETVDWVVEAFDRVRRVHPGAPKVDLHDISDRDGGFLSGHHSHQSGRDVDIAYYQERCPDGVCPFRPIGPEQLDVERQWALLQYWLENDQVEAVFIDYRLQAALFRHARRTGATREQLHRWFQYPRGRTFSVGAIRHYPKHDDHMHVRFVCPETDDECR